jgi:sugar lactone lactonase YvrE
VVGAAVLTAAGVLVPLGSEVASASPGTAPGIITTLAGNGTLGYSGDGGPATGAQLFNPEDAVADASGNTYIADNTNCVVRKVSSQGEITTVAGDGTCGYSGDHGPATAAELQYDAGVAVDASGNLYIADYGNHVVRRVDTSGVITTFAGTGTAGDSGDNGPATAAELGGPWAVRVDLSGDVYVADADQNVVRKVSPAGIITTVAGTGTPGYTGDHGPATSAELNYPTGLAVDPAGNMFVVDEGNEVVRKVDPSGTITTVAGNGVNADSGDNGPATGASLAEPYGVAEDPWGNLYISEVEGQDVRRVDGATGIITTIAGTGASGYSGDNGPATDAELSGPAGISLDRSGDLLIADYEDAVVREVSLASPTGQGYFTVAADGGVFNYGPESGFFGSAGSLHLNKPIVGMARTADGKGYWLVASDGGVFSYGTAGFYGSAGALALNKPIVGMAATPDGKGYWLVASDGGVFNYGDAGFYGSAGSLHLNKPIVGMAASSTGQGYWLVASDGGVFNYGDAGFFGSAGSLHLNQPVVGMAAAPDGQGYWLVASDGGIFNYGSSGFQGSAGSLHLNKPIVGMASAPDGKGYWLVASDGGIFNYGSSGFFGSAGALNLNQPVVGMAPTR